MSKWVQPSFPSCLMGTPSAITLKSKTKPSVLMNQCLLYTVTMYPGCPVGLDSLKVTGAYKHVTTCGPANNDLISSLCGSKLLWWAQWV